MAGNSLIGSLAVSLSLQTAAFQKGATLAEKRAQQMQSKMSGVAAGLKGFGAALVGSLAVGAVTGAISRGLEYASSLGEVAQQLGVTTSELQKYRYMATQVGLEQSEMDASLAKLTRTMGEAQQGSKPIVEAFGRLGISIEELRGKSADQVMNMVAEGLKGVADPAQRAAIMVDLFGRAGQKLMPLLSGGAKGLNQLSEEYRKMGVEISPENIAKADAAADSMSKLKAALEARIAGVVAENADGVGKFAVVLNQLQIVAVQASAKIGEWGYAIIEAGASTRRAVDSVIQTFSDMRQAVIDAVSNLYNGVKSYLLDKLNVVMDAVRAKVKAVGDAFFQLWDRVVGHSYVPDMVEGIGSEFNRLGGLMVDPATDATQRTAQAFAGMAESVIGSFQGILNAIKSGDWLSAVTGVVDVFSKIGAFGGGGATPSTDFGRNPKTGPIGMASGGSGIFGGIGGTDRNMLSLNGSPIARVSRGERFSVSPQNDNGRGGSFHFDLRGAVMTQDILEQINEMGARATVGGASLAQQQIGRNQRRRLA